MQYLWRVFTKFSSAATLAAVFTACGASHAESDSANAETELAADAIPVTLARVVRLPADQPLVVSGRVSHARDLKPAFKTGGIVAEILVDEGDRVVAGQPLARLDTREIDAGLAQARAGLAKAKRDLSRVDQLVGDAVLPSTTRDDAETAATVARAQVAGLAFNRATAELVAGAPGVVIKRLAEPGEVVAPGMPVLVIGEVEEGRFFLEVGVPARELARIAVGDEAQVTLDGETLERPARVSELAPALTPGTDRLIVTLAVEGAAPRGLVGVATFSPRADVTLPAVPITTLVEGLGAEASVWVRDPHDASRVLKRAVTLARIRPDGMALVAGGLAGVAEVIDAGNAWLDADARIVVVAETADDETAEVRDEAR